MQTEFIFGALISAYMRKSLITLVFIITQLLYVSAQESKIAVDGEKHLQNIKQLTFGGENAEAYFSFDGKQLIFQSTK